MKLVRYRCMKNKKKVCFKSKLLSFYSREKMIWKWLQMFFRSIRNSHRKIWINLSLKSRRNRVRPRLSKRLEISSCQMTISYLSQRSRIQWILGILLEWARYKTHLKSWWRHFRERLEKMQVRSRSSKPIIWISNMKLSRVRWNIKSPFISNSKD